MGTGYGAAATLWRTVRFVGRDRAVTVVGPDGQVARVGLLQSRFTALDTIGSQLLAGRYELTTRRLFEQLVRPGTSIVDVGANIGYFTALSAVLTGRTGRVIAVEPEPRNLAALRANIERNGLEQVRLVEAACGEHVGVAQLGVNSSESGWHRLVSHGSASTGLQTVPVALTTVDEVVAGQPVDLVKIDVEGFEGPVVAGMGATLAANPGLDVVLEYSPSQARLAGLTPTRPLQLLRQAGLRHAYLIREDIPALQRVDLEALAAGVKLLGRSVNLLLRSAPLASHASLPVLD